MKFCYVGSGVAGGEAEGAAPSPEYVRGDIAVGFNLVADEGGSVEALEACARSLSAVAVYGATSASSCHSSSVRRSSQTRRKHVMRNSLLPIITVMGVDVGMLVGSAIIVEAVFAWPGFGTLVVEAAKTRDYPVIQAAGFTIGVLVLAGSLVADFAYGLIDPRIRRRS